MPESLSHISLVQSLVRWVGDNLMGGNRGLILVDSPDATAKQKPPRIGGFVPDLYVPDGLGSRMVIGEAKTARDLEREHSLEQIKAFLLECSHHGGSVFVMAVPWYQTRLTRAIIREIQRRTGMNVSCVVLEELPE